FLTILQPITKSTHFPYTTLFRSEATYRSSGGDLEVIGFDSKLPEFLLLWAKANGADLISDDARTAQLDHPKVVEALDFANEIYEDRKSTRLNSSHVSISYAVFCL